MAFHSTSLDKEITAANYAGVCTSSVIREEKVDQPVSGSSSYKKKRREGWISLIKKETSFPRKPEVHTN